MNSQQELRFGVGTHVECNYSGEWKLGVITRTWYREADWPRGREMPYQVKLDDGIMIWAPIDSDKVIKKARAARSFSSQLSDFWQANSHLNHQAPPILIEALRPQPGNRYHFGENCSMDRKIQCRTVTLGGFSKHSLNTEYVEWQGSEFVVGDRETYWSGDCSLFIYFHLHSRQWTVAPACVWFHVKDLGEGGPIFAHSPTGAKIRDPSLLKAWYEVQGGAMLVRPEAGVKVLGKMDVVVIVTTQTLLSTLPGGESLLADLLECGSEGCRSDTCTCRCINICRSLKKLPSDCGVVAAKLAQGRAAGTLHASDAGFLSMCAAAAHGLLALANERKRVADDIAIRRLNEHALNAAKELLVEEEQMQQAFHSKARFRKPGNKLTSTRGLVQDTQGRASVINSPSISRSSSRRSSMSSTSCDRTICGHVAHGNEDSAVTCDMEPPRPAIRDIEEPISLLRHAFPMFDDEILSDHLMASQYELEQAVISLSALVAAPSVSLEPTDIPRSQLPRTRAGAPKTIFGHVLARTDHKDMPLYCFIVLIASSDSPKYKEGSIVRPIPEDRFRIRGDEKGHFWLKKSRVPEQGSVVEISFFEEDNDDYLQSEHGKYPHRNEDLLCTSLQLRSKSDLSKHSVARERLLALVVDDVVRKWPWGRGLCKFPSVIPGKDIWFVPAQQKHLPSVILLKINPQREVNFSYRNAASTRIGVDFTAGSKRLTNVPITASGYDETPHSLNMKFADKKDVDQLFILGLARAERRGPDGFNRMDECSEKAKSCLAKLNMGMKDFEEYCQILLIGTLFLEKQPDSSASSVQKCIAHSFTAISCRTKTLGPMSASESKCKVGAQLGTPQSCKASLDDIAPSCADRKSAEGKANPHSHRSKPCWYFENGQCNKGHACPYLHDTEGLADEMRVRAKVTLCASHKPCWQFTQRQRGNSDNGRYLQAEALARGRSDCAQGNQQGDASHYGHRVAQREKPSWRPSLKHKGKW